MELDEGVNIREEDGHGRCAWIHRREHRRRARVRWGDDYGVERLDLTLAAAAGKEGRKGNCSGGAGVLIAGAGWRGVAGYLGGHVRACVCGVTMRGKSYGRWKKGAG